MRAALAHPITWGAAAVLALNDHVLKQAWPGFVTGKLSDVAWLILAPVVLAPLLGGRRLLAWSICAVFFVVLQLWPPLGALFSATHVADAADLITLPALAVPWLIWRDRPKRDGRWLALPLLLPLLATDAGFGDFPYADGTWPCAETAEPWPTDAPLLVADEVVDAALDTDAFLRGISLRDAHGELQVVAVLVQPGIIAICPIDGLQPDTVYTWTLGPWHFPAPAHQLTRPSLFSDTVTFITDDGPTVPVDSPRDCAASVDVDALVDDPCSVPYGEDPA